VCDILINIYIDVYFAALYLKQMENNKNYGFDMSQFIKAVQRFENETGGDSNIFDQFVIRTAQTYPSINIKELFMTEKQRKKNKKLVAPKIQIVHPRKINESLRMTVINKQLIRSTQDNIALLPPKNVTDSKMKTTTYSCYLNLGCNFVTDRFHALKRHVRAHIDEKNQKEDVMATIENERIFQKQITSSSTPKVNEGNKSVPNAGNRESVLELAEVSQICDSVTTELLTDQKSRPLDPKTAYKHTTNDENSDLEETYSVYKRVTDWLHKSYEIMIKHNN